MEREAARDAFQTFGAAGWAERVEQLLADEPSTASSTRPPASVDTATFCCEGDTRTVCFGGRTVLVRDLKGMRYLERLLAEPGREFHVMDLVAAEEGTLPVGHQTARAELDGEAGAGLPVLDAQAREAYRRRLAEVEDDIEDARQMNDTGRRELAENDRDFLIAELKQAVGLAGRHRAVGSTTERARTSVTRSIRYAIARIDEHHPTLAAHLEHAVHTGTYCSYKPDPMAPVEWQVAPR